MSKFIVAVLILITVASSGCATRSANIMAGNSSYYQYSELSCSQLSSKMSQTASRLSTISSKQDKMATTDAVAMTVGMLIFWPALVVNVVTPDHKVEISQLKGDVEAMEMALAVKKCGSSNPRNFANNN